MWRTVRLQVDSCLFLEHLVQTILITDSDSTDDERDAKRVKTSPPKVTAVEEAEKKRYVRYPSLDVVQPLISYYQLWLEFETNCGHLSKHPYPIHPAQLLARRMSS